MFKPDQSFFKDQEDLGMCLSMHQPWASLLVHGFKRFEGREWTHKYRGPLYIHATQKKPEQELIDELEEKYRTLYRQVGYDLPAFPERYLTGCLVGRVDLIDVISNQEYLDTIPEKIREHRASDEMPAFHFVVRNPQYLDIPLKMSGSPNIYKLPKEMLFGARDKLRAAPYDWWPPEQYRRHLMGRFDIYPDEHSSWSRDDALAFAEKHSIERPSDFKQLSTGCFHLKGLLHATAQQAFVSGLREMCQENPSKMRFQQAQKLVAEASGASDARVLGGDEVIPEKKRIMLERNSRKFDCYTLDVANRDMSMHEIKMLGHTVEEGANKAVYQAREAGKAFGGGQQNAKA